MFLVLFSLELLTYSERKACLISIICHDTNVLCPSVSLMFTMTHLEHVLCSCPLGCIMSAHLPHNVGPLQVWPFFAWGLLVIAMNAARYEMLKSCASSIALLNIINSVLIRHHHVFFFSLVGRLALVDRLI